MKRINNFDRPLSHIRRRRFKILLRIAVSLAAAALAALIIFVIDYAVTDDSDRSSAPVIYTKDSRLYAKTTFSKAQSIAVFTGNVSAYDKSSLVLYTDASSGELTVLKNGSKKAVIGKTSSDKVSVSPNGRYLLYINESSELVLFDLSSETEKMRIASAGGIFGFGGGNSEFYCTEASPEGSSLFVRTVTGGSRKIDNGVSEVISFSSGGNMFYKKANSLYTSSGKKGTSSLTASGDITCFPSDNAAALYFICDGALYYAGSSGERTVVERSGVSSIIAADPKGKCAVYACESGKKGIYSIYISKNNANRYYICDTDSLESYPIILSEDMDTAFYTDIATKSLYRKDLSHPTSDAVMIDDNVYGLAVSKNGSAAAYTTKNAAGAYDLFLYVSGTRLLISDNAEPYTACFSPGGESLYYISGADKSGSGNLYCVGAQLSKGGVVPRLIDSEVTSFYPRGGKQAVYMRSLGSANGSSELKIFRFAKSESIDSGAIKLLFED